MKLLAEGDSILAAASFSALKKSGPIEAIRRQVGQGLLLVAVKVLRSEKERPH